MRKRKDFWDKVDEQVNEAMARYRFFADTGKLTVSKREKNSFVGIQPFSPDEESLQNHVRILMGAIPSRQADEQKKAEELTAEQADEFIAEPEETTKPTVEKKDDEREL